MLTEEEAKGRWCPFSRAMMFLDLRGQDRESGLNVGMLQGVVAGNRGLRGTPVECQCIASACMAWRGQDRAVETGRKIPTSTSAVKPEGNWYWSHSVDGPVWVETAVERVGYCGLAGEP